jgi:hypothetical protein
MRNIKDKIISLYDTFMVQPLSFRIFIIGIIIVLAIDFIVSGVTSGRWIWSPNYESVTMEDFI